MKPSRRDTMSLLAGAAPAALGALSAVGLTSPGHAQETKPKRHVATSAEGRSQKIETRIGRLEFTHDFANGYPTDATIEKLYDERDFQRGCQAYLWSLPAVSFKAWQRGVTQQLGAKNGQVVAILSLEARRGILTANATTPYYLGFADLSAGPLVMVIPPRGVQGGINDGWQQSIPDTESPGTYLVLAPGQKAPDDVAGYTVRNSGTSNIFLGVRLTDPDPASAKEALSQLRMYPYAQRDNPPKMDILDAGTKTWSALPPRGMAYWRRRFSAVSSMPPGTGWLAPPEVTRPRASRSCSVVPAPRTPQRTSVV